MVDGLLLLLTMMMASELVAAQVILQVQVVVLPNYCNNNKNVSSRDSSSSFLGWENREKNYRRGKSVEKSCDY